ncbi:MAG: glycosyltransferase family 39 protein [Candidatus Omnitrophica bacterium]|nr:glycosyltransferase family 39 protein [Candidatus Omnitrophota bacterium]
MSHNLKQLSLFFLALAVFAGFFLRTHNLDFPSIGYHNMKENENISLAQEIIKTGSFSNKGIYFSNAFDDAPVAAINSQPPLMAYQTVLAWNMFGENLWAPRILNVLFGIGAILVLYGICRIVFSDALAAAFAAIIIAIIPIAVFFSRNLQAESPAFFFMLLGNMLYLRFIASGRKYNIFLGVAAFILSCFYQFNFLIGALPFLFCVPFTRYSKKKKELFTIIAACLLPLLIAAWHYGSLIIAKKFSLTAGNFFEFLTPAYWRDNGDMVIWYLKTENFTFIFSFLAACGVALAFFKHKGLLNRYLIGWAISVLFYAILFAEELKQNNFSQMPFIALVCIASSYSVLFISQEARKFFERDITIFLMALILITSLSPVSKALQRMYGTLFLGADVAGESLKEFTKPEERIFLFTHAQGNAIARYAQRYMGWPKNIEDFKQKEKQYGVRFVCIYPAQFLDNLRKSDPQLFEYIAGNYHMKELGVLEASNQVMYFILEKGKDETRNINNYLQSFSGAIRPRTIYKIRGKYVFFHTMRP